MMVKLIRKSAGIIATNLAVLREMQSRSFGNYREKISCCCLFFARGGAANQLIQSSFPAIRCVAVDDPPLGCFIQSRNQGAYILRGCSPGAARPFLQGLQT